MLLYKYVKMYKMTSEDKKINGQAELRQAPSI